MPPVTSTSEDASRPSSLATAQTDSGKPQRALHAAAGAFAPLIYIIPQFIALRLDGIDVKLAIAAMDYSKLVAALTLALLILATLIRLATRPTNRKRITAELVALLTGLALGGVLALGLTIGLAINVALR